MSPESPLPALNLFEFGSSGHAPNFLRLCLTHWRDHEPGRVLQAIVTRRFLSRFPYVFDGLDNRPGSPVRWLSISEEDEAGVQTALDYGSGIIARPDGYNPTTVFWSLAEKYSARFPARHQLLMNLDEMVHQVAAHRRLPADFSAALFLPGFAYADADASPRRRVYTNMQSAMIRERVVKHPQLRTLFVLDEKVAADLRGTGTAAVTFLADPGQVVVSRASPAERDDCRRRLGVPDDGRRLYLFFGDMRPRKGLSRVLRAISRLKAAERRRMRLAIVGFAEPLVEEQIALEVADARTAGDIDIVRVASFVPVAEMHAWFDASDVVLAAYIRHTGSSGVLMLAASHGIPAISQAFGQMGRLVREHGLGISVDPEDADALAGALRQCLDGPPPGYDPAPGFAFARSQSPERFGEALFGSLKPHYS